MLEQDGATRATRGSMNKLPHCVQTSVVDLGPRRSGLSFQKKLACMCRRECFSQGHSDDDNVWQQAAAEVVERSQCQGLRVPTGRHVCPCVGHKHQWSRGDAVVLPAPEARALYYYFWYLACLARRRHSQSQESSRLQAAPTDMFNPL